MISSTAAGTKYLGRIWTDKSVYGESTTPVSGGSSGSTSGTSTGDSTNTPLWLILLVGGITGIAFASVRGCLKKREKR